MIEKIGFVGPGKMAGAIIGGLLNSTDFDAGDICIYGRSRARIEHFTSMGCTECKDLSEMNRSCKIIFLCIKPQNFPEVYEKLKPEVSSDNLYVSIAAGIDFANLQENLGSQLMFVRAMPNTPLLIGKGATALCRTQNVSDERFSAIKSIFELCGTACVIEEKQMNAVIAVSGSSPAYIYLFAKIICDYADKIGLDHSTAMKLFSQTLVGSAGMMIDSGLSEDALIDMVCSKGGTTIAAIDALKQDGFQEVLEHAMSACIKRAEELAAK